MSCGNHDSMRGLVKRFQGIKGMRRRKKYMMLVEEKGGKFFVEEMKLSFLIFMITNKCVMDLHFGL
jgi:hypothetical protein